MTLSKHGAAEMTTMWLVHLVIIVLICGSMLFFVHRATSVDGILQEFFASDLAMTINALADTPSDDISFAYRGDLSAYVIEVLPEVLTVGLVPDDDQALRRRIVPTADAIKPFTAHRQPRLVLVKQNRVISDAEVAEATPACTGPTSNTPVQALHVVIDPAGTPLDPGRTNTFTVSTGPLITEEAFTRQVAEFFTDTQPFRHVTLTRRGPEAPTPTDRIARIAVTQADLYVGLRVGAHPTADRSRIVVRTKDTPASRLLGCRVLAALGTHATHVVSTSLPTDENVFAHATDAVIVEIGNIHRPNDPYLIDPKAIGRLILSGLEEHYA